MTPSLLSASTALLVGLGTPIIVMGAFRLTVERLWPIRPARTARSGINLAAFLIWTFTQSALNPGLALFGTLLVNRLGGGLLALPDHGWASVGGFIAYFLIMDVAQYGFHRAQHAVPWLWAIHSLHHSDTEFDATTLVLHHWLSPLLFAFVTLPLGLVFKAPASYVALYGFLSYYTYVYHANVRLDFGRWAWLLNSPSFHRVHHSAADEHFDCNYAAFLPILDVLFGTYRPARAGEWPRVGLGDGSVPKDVFDLTFWPVSRPLRALLANAATKRKRVAA